MVVRCPSLLFRNCVRQIKCGCRVFIFADGAFYLFYRYYLNYYVRVVLFALRFCWIRIEIPTTNKNKKQTNIRECEIIITIVPTKWTLTLTAMYPTYTEFVCTQIDLKLNKFLLTIVFEFVIRIVDFCFTMLIDLNLQKYYHNIFNV